MDEKQLNRSIYQLCKLEPEAAEILYIFIENMLDDPEVQNHAAMTFHLGNAMIQRDDIIAEKGSSEELNP
jgi:hypothetical protein